MSIDRDIYGAIQAAGVDLLLSVPCAVLKGLLLLIDEIGEIQHVPATREEEAIGIAAGAFLGGRKPAILMQNSGLGNSVNAIKSLLELYRIPCAFIISHRGTAGEKVSAQVPMGQVTPALLDCIGVEAQFIESPDDIPKVTDALRSCFDNDRPMAVLLSPMLWEATV
jgi:sulfopyruvate decarboxylase subunit alpha